MPIPILRQGRTLIASFQGAPTDLQLEGLLHGLAVEVGRVRATGVVVDVAAVDVLDSYATRMLQLVASTLRLRGAQVVVVGFQPEVALAMVQLGLRLEGVPTALDLDEGLALLARSTRTSDR